MLLYDPISAMSARELAICRKEFPSDTSTDDALRQFVHSSRFQPGELARVKQRSPRRHLASLVARGLSIDARDHVGETPLLKLGSIEPDTQQACGVLQALKVLEDAGADFQARNHLGESVLHKLAKVGSIMDDPRTRGWKDPEEDLQESFKWLGAKGVDVAWEDESGRTCLDVAAATGADWMLELCKRK